MSETTYTGSVTLEIEGMTCAGCVSRVERTLNRLDGVDASRGAPRGRTAFRE